VEKMRGFVEEVDAPNLRLAVDIGHVAQSEKPEQPDLDDVRMLLVSAPVFDSFGRAFDAHAPVAGSGLDLSPLAKVPSDAIIVYDAAYSGWNDVYRDIRVIEPAVGKKPAG
jgi:hypothetical protein